MKQSESITNLAKSLVIAQAAIEAGVLKNQTNETFASTYADLGSVINACKTALNAAGITLIQSPTTSEKPGYVSLTTRLLHESGEWIEDTATAPMVHLDAPGYGSVVTVLRRYAMQAIFGLYQADSDDDGQSARQDGYTKEQIESIVKDKLKGQSNPKPGTVSAANSQQQDRLDKWLLTIKSADTAKLKTVKKNAEGTFSGQAASELAAAIAIREAELRSEAHF